MADCTKCNIDQFADDSTAHTVGSSVNQVLMDLQKSANEIHPFTVRINQRHSALMSISCERHAEINIVKSISKVFYRQYYTVYLSGETVHKLNEEH